FWEPVPLEADLIEAVELHAAARGNDVRRHVLGHARAAADEAVASNAHELVDDAESRDIRPFLDRHVSGELRSVADDDVVADVAVVGEMHVRHDEASASDGGAVRFRGAAV